MKLILTIVSDKFAGFCNIIKLCFMNDDCTPRFQCIYVLYRIVKHFSICSVKYGYMHKIIIIIYSNIIEQNI